MDEDKIGSNEHTATPKEEQLVYMKHPVFTGDPYSPPSLLSVVVLLLSIASFFVGYLVLALLVIGWSNYLGEKCWNEGCTALTWKFAKASNIIAKVNAYLWVGGIVIVLFFYVFFELLM